MVFPENLPALSESLWLETPLASKSQMLEGFGAEPCAERNSNPERKVTKVMSANDEKNNADVRKLVFIVKHHEVSMESQTE